MPNRRMQSRGRVALASVALCALSAAAFANDLPPSSESAAKLQAFLSTYLGKAAPAAVSPANPGFSVAFDLAAAAAPLATAGFAIDPATAKYHVVEQSDGLWRAEFSDFPTLVVHFHQPSGNPPLVGTETFAFVNPKGQALIDPALGFWRSAATAVDSVNLEAIFPGIKETVQAAGLKFDATGQADADGSISSTMNHTASNFSFKVDVDPKALKAAKSGGDAPATDAQPYSIDVSGGQMSADIKLNALKTHALLDLWAFLVAHPSRAELAAQEATFKSLLTAAVAGQPKLDETASLEKVTAQTGQGAVTMDSAKVGISGAGGSAGAFGERFAVDGLKLPDGLVPEAFRGLAPTSFAVGFRASGFDVAATAAEAIADMRLAGDGPIIAPDDAAKVRAKLIGPDGIVVDVEPSHIVAPLLDLSFAGRIVLKGAKPTGTMTVHMKNFDKTLAALKTLGPDVETKAAPMLAMAKGLAKTDSDGSLVWVGEIGADGVMKVNGLPLGKAPM